MRTHSRTLWAPTADELAELARRRDHPVVSVLLPRQAAAEGRLTLRNLARDLASRLMQDQNAPRGEGSAAALADIADDHQMWIEPTVSLAVYLDGSELVGAAEGPAAGEPLAVVAPRFHVAHLIGALRRPRFAVLALSRGSARLYRTSKGELAEVATGGLPASMHQVLRLDDREPHLQSHGSVRHGGGGMVGAIHGQGGRSDRGEDLARYLRFVAAEVEEVLGGEPLVLAATEELAAAYRRASHDSANLAGVMPGNSERATPVQLMAASVEIVDRHVAAARDAVVAQMDGAVGTGRISTDPGETLTAAYDGRVERLVVASDERMWGRYDIERRQVRRLGAADDAVDLLNEASAETWLHRGDVVAVPGEEVPGPWPMAAQLRF